MRVIHMLAGRAAGHSQARPAGRRAARLLHGRRYVAVALAAGVAVLAAACGSSGTSSGTSSSNAKATVTIAYAAPVPDHMVPAVTEYAGFFKKFGITAKIEFLQQSDLLPAMIAGKVQFATLAAPGYEIPDLSGSQFQAIGQFEDSFDAELVSNPKYPTMASLNGKSIAISSPGTFSDLLAQIAERKYHITLHEVPTGNLTDSIDAFESGTVAAMSDISPNQIPLVNAKLHGVHVLVDWRSSHGVPAIDFVGYKPWLAAHRATVINVMKAINEGFAYFKSNPTQTVKIIAKVTGEPLAEAQSGYEDTLKALSSTTIPSVAAEKTVLSYLKSTEPKAATFNPANIVDASYDKAAGA